MRDAAFVKACELVVEFRKQVGALEAERDDLRKIVEMVHADLGIQRGDHVGEAISELKKEASDATARQRMTEVRALKYSAQAEDARREIERLREERDQFRAKLEAATGADHTVPAAVPQHGVIGKTVRHSTGRVGRVMSVKTDWVDGHGWTLYAVQRSDGVAGSQIWHASNCTIVEERPAKEPETVCWVRNNCEPCDPPGSTHAEPDLTQLHAKGKEAWSDVPNATQWVEDMRGNTEASHDTPAGKEAAEAVVRDSQMTDTHDCGPNCPPVVPLHPQIITEDVKS